MVFPQFHIDSEIVAHPFEERNPAFIQLIEQVIR